RRIMEFPKAASPVDADEHTRARHTMVSRRCTGSGSRIRSLHKDNRETADTTTLVNAVLPLYCRSTSDPTRQPLNACDRKPHPATE
ncbi:MAG TPA: hypothetical protein VFB66_10110, partial [Tepidisphaeraceae bacterium]|nr:hypothetical protein [Tepidisphaeraceae bacterium]